MSFKELAPPFVGLFQHQGVVPGLLLRERQRLEGFVLPLAAGIEALPALLGDRVKVEDRADPRTHRCRSRSC